MIYVGIDVAKKSHFASVINSDCETLVKPFKFTNDENGFNLLLKNISCFNKAEILVGLEATGIYGDNLTKFLFDNGFSIGRINPIQTDSIRSSNIRKTKNDKIDTSLIIQCLMLKKYTLVTKKDIEMTELKSLCRFKLDLIKSQSKYKCQLVGCIDIVFPELNGVFKDLQIKTVYELLSKYSSAYAISHARIDTLTKLISKASRGHFKKDTAIALKDSASHSIAIKNSSIELQIKILINQINFIQKQIDFLDDKINNSMENSKSVITSIPGIGNWLGAIIISEIGDISKFSCPKKLLAFAGLDPSVKQSGEFEATNNRISKRGSKSLRYAINTAASLIIWKDNTFHNYYITKMASGKSHLNAVGHVSHKLTRVIFKLLSTNTCFETSCCS